MLGEEGVDVRGAVLHPAHASGKGEALRPEEQHHRLHGGAAGLVLADRPGWDREELHRLAVLAGVHLYLPAAEVGKATLWATGGVGNDVCVLEVQAMEDTTLHLRFPSAQPIRDAISGRSLGQGPVLPLRLSKGETRVLMAE